MGAAVIVPVLTAAAEAYAKQLGQTVGEGIVETLLHQGEIARDLNEIKQMLAALSDFIRNKLPALVEQSVDLSFARRAEYEVVEKAKTIKGAIASLNDARRTHAPSREVDFLVSELVGHGNSILELGGTLIAYGQAYYASVGISFGAALNAFAAAAKESPYRARALLERAEDWQARLKPWVDPARPSSLTAVRDWLVARHDLGGRAVPSFETWNTHTTREVAISWCPMGDGIFVAGAWFGYWKEKGLQGDTLGTLLKAGVTFDKAIADGTLSYTLPEWWTVKANSPTTMADYESIAQQLAALINDYYNYDTVSPPAKNAVTLIDDTLNQIAKLLAVKAQALAGLASEPVITGAQTEAQRLERVAAVFRENRPGIGLTRRF